MRGLIGAIRSIFANELEIRVSREVVTIAWDGQSRSVHPVVHIAPGPGQVRIVEVGDVLHSPEAILPVPVFGPLPAGVSLAIWAEALTVFMDFTIKQARLGIVAIRPTVHLRGVHSLGALPSGDPEQVLTNAVLRAHAFHCTVED